LKEMADTLTIVKDIVLGIAGCAGLWQLLQRKLDLGAEGRKRKDEAMSEAARRQAAMDKEQRRIMTEEGMFSVHEVCNTIKYGFTDHGAERVILFSGHNCGGIPSPTKPYYVTAMQWHAESKKSTDVIEDYRRIRVDPAYIKMLYTITCAFDADEPNEDGWTFRRTDRAILLETEKMHPCQLKTYYEHEGVVQSMVVFLSNSDYNIYFLSIARYSGKFTEHELASIMLNANKVAQEVQKW
jgi:hypothetical protein